MGRRWTRENTLSEKIRKPERRRPKPIPVCEDISRELARVLCIHNIFLSKQAYTQLKNNNQITK